jgi:lipid-A-disaccharide synthase
LPNILAGEWLVPELLQDDATPENLAQAMGNWIRHRDVAARARVRFGEIHATLAIGNAGRVVDALRPLLAPLVGGADAQKMLSQSPAYAEATRAAA